MTTTDWTGAIGVTILLLAFLLNLMGKIHKDGWPYLSLNLLGAGAACLASAMLLLAIHRAGGVLDDRFARRLGRIHKETSKTTEAFYKS